MQTGEGIEEQQPTEFSESVVDPSAEARLECRLDFSGESGVPEDET
jgi:hypothetical protein